LSKQTKDYVKTTHSIESNYLFVDEHHTSQTCSKCRVINKSNRKYRGLYICKCDNVLNADVNRLNILKRVVLNPVMNKDRGYLNNLVRVRLNYSN